MMDKGEKAFFKNQTLVLAKNYNFKNKTLKELSKSHLCSNLPYLKTVLRYFDLHPEFTYQNFAHNLERTTFYDGKSDSSISNNLPFVTEANFITGDINLIKNRKNINPVYLELFYFLHEYYHIASIHQYSNEQGGLGFYHQYKDISIGQGINEGCCQFFVYKDMGLKDYYLPVVSRKDGKLYSTMVAPMETSIVALLSHVVEENVLRALFLDGNLGELINILSIYRPKEDVMDWIYELDQLSYQNRNGNLEKGMVSKSSMKQYFKCRDFVKDIFLEKYPSLVFDHKERKSFYQDMDLSFKAFSQGIKVVDSKSNRHR